jgi:hypothetical protein
MFARLLQSFNVREVRKNLQAAGKFNKFLRGEHAKLFFQTQLFMDHANRGSAQSIDGYLMERLLELENRRLSVERNGARFRKHAAWNCWATLETWFLLKLQNLRGQCPDAPLQSIERAIKEFIDENLSESERAKIVRDFVADGSKTSWPDGARCNPGADR